MKKFNLLFGGIGVLSIFSLASCIKTKPVYRVMQYQYSLNNDGNSYSLYFYDECVYDISDAQIDLESEEGIISFETEELRIPSTHKELPVTGVLGFDKNEQTMFGDGLQHLMYDKYTKLKDVTLPDTLVSFKGSFLNGFGLNVTWYNKEKYLKSESNDYFYLMSSEAKYSDTVNIHPDCKIIGAKAFEDFSFTSIELPKNLKTISNNAFWSSGLESITLPESLLYIGDYAFGYSKIKSLYIPSNVRTIGANPFYGYSLVEITVDSKNLNYTLIDKSLFENETKKLICLSSGSQIPDDCLIIGKSSLKFAPDNLVIPKGVKEIEDNSFNSSEIYLPKALEKVGNISFSKGDVYYPSTVKNFKEIFSQFFKQYSKHCETLVHCSDGIIDLNDIKNYPDYC